jgi:medium-chain acyl-[acyl-carrier-protein] hydrolase
MHLFVSGMEAPDQRRPRAPLHLMPDEEFIAELRALEGTAAEVFDAPELLAAVVPTLRADFEVCETHAHRPGPPLGCPITAFGGLADPQVSRERLLAWRRHTAIGFRSCMVAGDHFFIRHAPGAVLDRIAAELACEPALAEAS